MKHLNSQKYAVVIEKSKIGYSAAIPELPACVAPVRTNESGVSAMCNNPPTDRIRPC